MSERFEALMFALQRASAVVLAPLVLLHLVVMFYAVHGGLGADEILARTRGSLAFGLFYGVFVLAVSVHAPIGLRNLLREWTPWQPRTVVAVSVAFSAVLLLLGLRAVAGVVS